VFASVSIGFAPDKEETRGGVVYWQHLFAEKFNVEELGMNEY
jgi:hypothetical protein